MGCNTTRSWKDVPLVHDDVAQEEALPLGLSTNISRTKTGDSRKDLGDETRPLKASA